MYSYLVLSFLIVNYNIFMHSISPGFMWFYPPVNRNVHPNNVLVSNPDHSGQQRFMISGFEEAQEVPKNENQDSQVMTLSVAEPRGALKNNVNL